MDRRPATPTTSTTVTTTQRTRIRIRPKAPAVTESTPTTRPRQRNETPTVKTTRPSEITTMKPLEPKKAVPRNRVPPTIQEEPKQTLGQSLSGIFDPSQLTVFSEAPVREEPRFISQDTPQQQFSMPVIPKMRILPAPKIVSAAKPDEGASDIKQEVDQRFLRVQELVREEPQQVLPLNIESRPQQPPQPFTAFQAQPQQPNPRPIPFKTQPAIQQPSSIPQQSPAPAPLPQQVIRPQPPVQRQPEIRPPQPIPFQTRPAPATPAARPAAAQPPQTSTDLFQDRPSLFSQPIDIPTNAGGASFSYEAILG